MKKRITVTVEKKHLSWLDERVDKHIFANRSHGFEFLIASEKRTTHGTDEEDIEE